MQNLHRLKIQFLSYVFGITLLFALVLAPGDAARAETLSEHNELHAGLNAAIMLLVNNGCELPELVRTERLKLTTTGGAVTLSGKEYSVVCKKLKEPCKPESVVHLQWSHPTSRKDNTPLQFLEIEGYEIWRNSSLFMTVGRVRKVEIYGLEPGNHSFQLKTIDTNGLVSDFSPPIEVSM